MNKKKIISLFLSAAMIVGFFNSGHAGAADKEYENTIQMLDKSRRQAISTRINEAIVESGVNITSDNVIELIILSQLESDISNELYGIGATDVVRFAEGAYKINISAKNSSKITEINDVVTVSTNHKVELDPLVNQGIANPNLEYSNKVTSIKDLWDKGYTGQNTTIAIIDTGIEPDNELLKMTSDGKLKIVDYQEFLGSGLMANSPSEGDVKLSQLNPTSEKISIPYSYFEIGDGGKAVTDYRGSLKMGSGSKEVTISKDLIGKQILAGVYSESRMITDTGVFFDANNNSKVDDYAFICLDNNEDGNYEDVIFDTNNNLDFADEKTTGVYKDVAKELKDVSIFEMKDGQVVLNDNNEPIVLDEYKEQYSRLFNTIENTVIESEDIISKTRFNFVFTRIDNLTFGNWYANIATDTRGHGTHVAGDAAANGYLQHDFVDKAVEPTQKLFGPAKDAQLMALRVFGTKSGTSEDMYITAMQYAAVNGADVVNMSLGSQPVITDGTSLGAQYADLLTAKYGTMFVISNGNEGPALNSNGSPGDSWYALTVGAYCPSFYTVGEAYKQTENQMWIFSSMGPTDDGRLKPDLVAPGSMISASPMWEVVGNGYDELGTFKDQGDTPQIGYSRAQGTSMAAPYTAGVAASLKQAIKEELIPYHPLLLKEAMMKSADTTINNGKYNPAEIGSGMVNPLGAYEELISMKTSNGLPKVTTGQSAPTTWPYDYNDRSLMYTTYQDIYVVPNVQYKNNESMRYVNAAGLYVRDWEIPKDVEVKLPNITGSDVNLYVEKVAYGSGQNTDWITTEANVSIKDGETNYLNLSIDQEKLVEGINTLILKLDDPNTYQLDCTIPVVVIKSNQLGIDNSEEIQSGTVAPGGFERKFVKVNSDTDAIKVSIEVPEGTQGRITPYIYFPNGRKYNILEDNYPFVGLMSDGSFVNKKEFIIRKADLERAALDLSKANPNANYQWNGAWEIDAYCSYASPSSVNYKLEVSMLGLITDSNLKTVELAAGNTFDGTIKTINNSDTDLAVKSYGFIDLNKNMVKERVEGFGEFNTMEKLFQIKESEKNVFHRAIVTNPSYGEGARVWLYLYKASVNPDGSYTIIKPMINKFINVQYNGMESEMITNNLEPGYYVLALFGAIMESGPVDFDLVTQVLSQSDALESTIKINDNTSVIGNGQSADVRYTVKAPSEGGNYIAGITFEDTNGKIVKSYPIRAKVTPTNNVLEVKQQEVPLLNGDMMVNIDAKFPSNEDKETLYGVEFKVNYNPNEVSAEEVLRGDIFTDENSYNVKTEVVKDGEGNETGEINFAYAFKGMAINGATEGNIAKIKFKANKIGAITLDMLNLIVGNYEASEKAVRIVKENISVATPDVNNDGVVDMKDYSRCAYSYGSLVDDGSGRYRDDVDVNKDGIINDLDLNYIIEYFNNNF